MIIHLAADHAGFEMKEFLREALLELGYNIMDHGSFDYDEGDDYPDFIKLAGNSAKGTYLINVPTPDILPYDIAKKFLKDYKAKYGMMPASIWTLLNIDGLRAILHGIKETKSTDTKKISNYLHNLKDFPGITGPVTFRSDGERIGGGYMAYEIQGDNSYKIVYK